MNELTPVNNPHDAYFKATFGRIDFAKDFLNNYLPQELISYINIETLSPEPTTYLTKELKEQFTDLIYKAETELKTIAEQVAEASELPLKEIEELKKEIKN